MNNLVGLWPNLSRAYEIALLGKYSINIVAEFSYKSFYSDVELIKEFFNEIEFSTSGTLTIQITPPVYTSISTLTRNYSETKNDIFNRVNTAKEFEKPKIHYNTDVNKALLKNFFNRISSSVNTHDQILDVAGTIAQLAHKDRIYPEHLAEAMQYCFELNPGTYLNIEPETVHFGAGITIKKQYHDIENINNAIKYLESFK